LLRRLGGALVTLWLALSLAFVALRLIPGDAIAAQMAQSGASEAQIAARRATLGLDRPLPAQYVDTMAGLLRGDLGISIMSGRPVAEMIGEQFGATLALAAGALVVGAGLGLAGDACGVERRSQCAPERLSWRPVAGLAGLTDGHPAIHFQRAVSCCLRRQRERTALPGAALAGARLQPVRERRPRDGGQRQRTRRADFVRTARASGLRARRILRAHILRASLSPILAVLALQTGFVLGGAVVTEMIFVRQGVGQVLLRAINDRDFPVVQGIVALSAVLYSLVNLAADSLAALLDPRVRFERP
jgi:peptide/nickel transport system permease protein